VYAAVENDWPIDKNLKFLSRPEWVQRMTYLAELQGDRRTTAGMLPFGVARPSCEGRYVGERWLPASLTAASAFPGMDPHPDEPRESIRVLAFGDHRSSLEKATSRPLFQQAVLHQCLSFVKLSLRLI
jgi:hypothetical protein